MDNFLYVWDRMHRIATRLEQAEARIKELETTTKIETTIDNLMRRGLIPFMPVAKHNGYTNGTAKLCNLKDRP